MAYRAYCFVVPTAAGTEDYLYGEDGPVMCGWDTGTITDETGLPSKVRQAIADNTGMNDDMKTRLKRLLMAIEKSVEEDLKFSQGNCPDIRIFVAPEFYFRPPKSPTEACGEYTNAQFIALSNFLEDYFVRFKYYHDDERSISNWLFLCGTCVYNLGSDVPGLRLLFNSMLAYAVDTTGTAIAQPFRKLCTSHIDGIDDKEDINWEQQNQLCYYNVSEITAHYFPSFHVFVEICLETSLGLWKNEWQGGAVEAHVISAAGMPMDDITNKDGSTAVRIRNDGMLDEIRNMTSFMLEGSRKTVASTEITGVNYQWSSDDLENKVAQKGLEVKKEYLLRYISPSLFVNR